MVIPIRLRQVEVDNIAEPKQISTEQSSFPSLRGSYQQVTRDRAGNAENELTLPTMIFHSKGLANSFSDPQFTRTVNQFQSQPEGPALYPAWIVSEADITQMSHTVP